MKTKYEVRIHFSEIDDHYIAEAPELPGAMADGSSHEEALKNLSAVIDEWIETAEAEGRDVPIPKALASR